MITFYYNAGPSPTRVALMLEETGLRYEPIPIDTYKGEQHEAKYLAINPNGKVPAIVDGETTVFDSNAILLYLAEKTGKFLPADTPNSRGELLSWLMFVASGVGPFSGQSVHFSKISTEKIEYAIHRYMFEAHRHYAILDARLAKNKYIVGDAYSIVDMAAWGWARLIPLVLDESYWTKYPNLKRLVDEISARPAAARALAIKDAHKHAFKTEFDEKARKNMFKYIDEKSA